MRGIIEYIFGRQCRGDTGHAPLVKLPVRSMRELHRIESQHGSAIWAALNGEINAEEYLRLEQDDG
jgi:hypothetical protein